MTAARRFALAGWLLCVVGCAPQAPPQSVAAPEPTAPAVEPAPPQSELHFAAYGDTRSFPDLHRRIVALIAGADPDLVLQTGDMVGGDGTNQQDWDEFLAITEPIRTGGNYYPVYGNHDRGLKNLLRLFNNLPAATAEVGYYTFTRDNCRFIGLNTNTLRLAGKDETQVDWLKQTLAANESEHLFVFLHHPLWTIGSYAPGELTVRQRLQPIFDQYPAIRAVFAGHDHGYYRTERNGIWYIVTAGGGAPLYPQDPKLAQPGDVYRSCRHFMEFRVKGPQVTATATDIDGHEFDRFELGTATPEPAAVAADG